MAQVKFKRIESSTDINDIPILDGQLIYTKDGKQYIDYETQRIDISVGPTKDVILWENESPNSNFESQQISLSSSDYDELLLVAKDVIGGPIGYKINIILLKGQDYVELYNIINSSGTLKKKYRQILRNSDTSYTIGGCYTSGESGTTNGYLVPLYVIGKKTGLFGE